MIDTFSGIDSETGGHFVFFAIAGKSNVSFFKVRSGLQYFKTQGMGQSSIFLTFCTIYVILGGGLGLWVGWERRNPRAPYLSIIKHA